MRNSAHEENDDDGNDGRLWLRLRVRRQTAMNRKYKNHFIFRISICPFYCTENFDEQRTENFRCREWFSSENPPLKNILYGLNTITMENLRIYAPYNDILWSLRIEREQQRKIGCQSFQCHKLNTTFGFSCCTDTKSTMIASKIITRIVLSHSDFFFFIFARTHIGVCVRRGDAVSVCIYVVAVRCVWKRHEWDRFGCLLNCLASSHLE